MKAIILGMTFVLVACSKQPERACSPPPDTWRKPHSFGLITLNKIAIGRDGKTYWNGTPITSAKLDQYLSIVPTMNPVPVTFLETETGAPCAALEAVRKQMEKRLDCEHGGPCADGIFDVWQNVPPPPGTPPS